MSMTFYYGSGSPFSWYVWFVLEHKQLRYQLELLSLQNGELKSPQYLAIHHRGKVPALTDHGQIFLESLAIVEYLEDRYPEIPVFPIQAEIRCFMRQLIQEAHGYLYPPLRLLMQKTMMHPQEMPSLEDKRLIETAIRELRRELDYFENIIVGDFVCGEKVTAGDFALYPLLALVDRIREKAPDHNLLLSPGLKTRTLMARIEKLPLFEITYPPHWR